MLEIGATSGLNVNHIEFFLFEKVEESDFGVYKGAAKRDPEKP